MSNTCSLHLLVLNTSEGERDNTPNCDLEVGQGGHHQRGHMAASGWVTAKTWMQALGPACCPPPSDSDNTGGTGSAFLAAQPFLGELLCWPHHPSAKVTEDTKWVDAVPAPPHQKISLPARITPRALSCFSHCS